jgi:16S rRNA (uracil1498-N3)-methyltransferase
VPRFHLDLPLRAGSTCTLTEDAAHHAVHVLRVREGDEVTLFNGRGGEYRARVASIDRLKVGIDLLAHDPVERESPLQVTLVQGVSSGERMEFTIRKAVELGVAEIRPVLAAASVARPKGERAASRQAHWQKIAISACEQCGRNQVPAVHPLIEARDYRAEGDAARILLSPASQVTFSKSIGKSSLSFVIAAGPEAGFSPDEERVFAGQGFLPVRLGPRVLRTETAAIVASALCQHLWGDLGRLAPRESH